jgi:hypothetical protein
MGSGARVPTCEWEVLARGCAGRWKRAGDDDLRVRELLPALREPFGIEKPDEASSGDLWPASQSTWKEGGRASSGLGNIAARPSRIVAFGRPGGEDHDDTSTTITCDAVALARLEREQRSWPRVNDVAARLDPRRSLDHHQPGSFANLVVA